MKCDVIGFRQFVEASSDRILGQWSVGHENDAVSSCQFYESLIQRESDGESRVCERSKKNLAKTTHDDRQMIQSRTLLRRNANDAQLSRVGKRQRERIRLRPLRVQGAQRRPERQGADPRVAVRNENDLASRGVPPLSHNDVIHSMKCRFDARLVAFVYVL